MATHSSTLAGKSHGQRSLVGCSPWGHKESDTSERLLATPWTAAHQAPPSMGFSSKSTGVGCQFEGK